MSLNMPQVKNQGPKKVQIAVKDQRQLTKALEVLEGMGYEVSDSIRHVIILKTTYIRTDGEGEVKWSERPGEEHEDITWMIPKEELAKESKTKKWYIPDRRHWAEFQEFILSQGNTWRDGYKGVLHGCGPCYYLTNGVLTWDADVGAYNNYPAEEQQWETSNPPHAHHRLMAKFAEDAAISQTPWKFGNVVWEVELHGRWVELDSCPSWEPDHKYRRRLRLKVGDVTDRGLVVAITENSFVMLNGGKEFLVGKEEME